jgi:hypothetical protein
MESNMPHNYKTDPLWRAHVAKHLRNLPEMKDSGAGDASDEDVIGFYKDTFGHDLTDQDFDQFTNETFGHDYKPSLVPAAAPMPDLMAPLRLRDALAPTPAAPSSTKVGAEPNTYGRSLGHEVGEMGKATGKFVANIPVELGRDIAGLPSAANTMMEPGRVAQLLALVKVAPDSEAGRAAKKELESLGRAGGLAVSTAAGLGTGALLAKTVLKGVAGAAIKGGLEGAAAGGSYEATRSAAEGESPEEIARRAGAGALGGGLLGGGLVAGGRLAGRVLKGAPTPEPVPVQTAEPALSLATPEPHPVVQRLTSAIRAAQPLQKEQARLISAERSKRLGAAMGAMEKVGGEQGYIAALSRLKGSMPKAQFESVRSIFSQPEIDELFNVIGRHPRLTGFEKVSAQGALQKLLGTDGAGAVPTRGELALMHETFGKEFVQAALSKRTLLQKAGAVMGDVLNLPRALMSSFDMSAPFRQSIAAVGRPEFWRNLGPMVKSFGSENFYRASMDEIAARPTYGAMREAGLALTDLGPLSPHEEAFYTNLAEKIPGVRHSARAFTGFVTRMRADLFDSTLKHAEASGVDVADPAFLKSLASFANVATGRGELGALAPAGNALSTALFSPRLLASRINTLNPQWYMSLDPIVRREALRTHLSSAAAVMGLLGAAAMIPGVTVGRDPRSADFGKIKVGNTRFDLTGGFAQYPRIAAQLLTGKIISSTTGKEMMLGDPGKYRPLTRYDIILRFFENKESPVVSYITGLLKQQNSIGQPFDVGKETLSRFIPMLASDVYDAVQEWGAKGALVGIPGFFGAGTQTYGGDQKSSTPGSVKAAAKFQTVRMKDGKPVDVNVRIPAERAPEFANEMMNAEVKATQELVSNPEWDDLTPARQQSLIKSVVEKYRQRVRSRWLKGNAQVIDEGARTGKEVELRSPEENDVLQAMRDYNRAARAGDQRKIEAASTRLMQARAALVELTSSERAMLPHGLAFSDEGILGLSPGETARAATALLPDLEDAGVPPDATPKEVLEFYWDTHASTLSPSEFKEFLRWVADQSPAPAQEPAEGPPIEPEQPELAPASENIVPSAAAVPVATVEPLEPKRVVSLLMKQPGSSVVFSPIRFAQKAPNGQMVWIGPDGRAVAVSDEVAGANLYADGFVRARLGASVLSAWASVPPTKEQTKTLESLLPDGRGLRGFSGRLVVDGEEKEWTSDIGAFALAEPSGPSAMQTVHANASTLAARPMA